MPSLFAKVPTAATGDWRLTRKTQRRPAMTRRNLTLGFLLLCQSLSVLVGVEAQGPGFEQTSTRLDSQGGDQVPTTVAPSENNNSGVAVQDSSANNQGDGAVTVENPSSINNDAPAAPESTQAPVAADAVETSANTLIPVATPNTPVNPNPGESNNDSGTSESSGDSSSANQPNGGGGADSSEAVPVAGSDTSQITTAGPAIVTTPAGNSEISAAAETAAPSSVNTEAASLNTEFETTNAESIVTQTMEAVAITDPTTPAPSDDQTNSTEPPAEEITNNSSFPNVIEIKELENATTPEDDEGLSLQTQIYMVSGILGGIILFLAILVLALALSVARLRDEVTQRHVRYIPDESSPTTTTMAVSPQGRGGQRQQGDPIHAYDNSGFNNNSGGGLNGPDSHEMQERRVDSKADLERMGYSVYNGKQHENRPSHPRGVTNGNPDRDSKSTLMRYEDGVVPMSYSNHNERNRNSRDFNLY